MRFSTRQFVLALALSAVWQMLGGADQALADYVPTPSLVEGSEVPTSLLGPENWEAQVGAGAVDNRKGDQLSEEDRERSDYPSPLARLLASAWHMGSDSGTTSSSGPSLVNGPTNQCVGPFAPFELVQSEIVGILSFENNASSPFSVSSRLFRPPRAG